MAADPRYCGLTSDAIQTVQHEYKQLHAQHGAQQMLQRKHKQTNQFSSNHINVST